MSDGLYIIYYIFNKFVDLIFNSFEISNLVSIGWVSISVVIFALLIKNIVNLPRNMSSFDKFRPHRFDSVSLHTDKRGNKFVTKNSTISKRRY